MHIRKNTIVYIDLDSYIRISYMNVSVSYCMKFCCGNKNYLKKIKVHLYSSLWLLFT